MAKLVLSKDSAVVHQCFLDAERVSIGRLPPAQLIIDDPLVAAEHAAIVAVGNDHILEDLRTAHGTFVNGKPVERHILQHGDIIGFGAFELRYLNPRATAEADLDRTILIPGLYSKKEAFDEPGAAAEEMSVRTARSARVRFPRGRVAITAGRRAGRTIELDRVVATFGRPGGELAVIARRPQGYFLTHVEGRRFPRVNKQTIAGNPHQLRNGDVIEVADEKMEFLLD
jgi:pSer/pThr/pTyr-binding forkhead associated (FHA) protein